MKKQGRKEGKREGRKQKLVTVGVTLEVGVALLPKLASDVSKDDSCVSN